MMMERGRAHAFGRLPIFDDFRGDEKSKKCIKYIVFVAQNEE
jgi:hypothetical protein